MDIFVLNKHNYIYPINEEKTIGQLAYFKNKKTTTNNDNINMSIICRK